MAGNTWAHGCRGKVPYPSRRRAAAAVRVLRQTPDVVDPHTLMPYRCREGRHWHVGHCIKPIVQPLKRVRAKAGDVVEITWRMPDGSERIEKRTAPDTEAKAS